MAQLIFSIFFSLAFFGRFPAIRNLKKRRLVAATLADCLRHCKVVFRGLYETRMAQQGVFNPCRMKHQTAPRLSTPRCFTSHTASNHAAPMHNASMLTAYQYNYLIASMSVPHKAIPCKASPHQTISRQNVPCQSCHTSNR